MSNSDPGTTQVRTRLAADFVATDQVGLAVAQCWLDVSNAGGAVGFPFPPVSKAAVAHRTRLLEQDIASGSVLLFVAERDGDVLGWVSMRLNRFSLTEHWATVERLQSRPEQRGMGIGKQLMQALSEHAHMIGLEHLRLVLRGGENLEAFYASLGWREIGRHPDALRLADGDRDEVSMMLDLAQDLTMTI